MKKERSRASPWKRLEKAEIGPVTNLACIPTVFLTLYFVFPYNGQNSHREEGKQSRVMTFLEEQAQGDSSAMLALLPLTNTRYSAAIINLAL